LGGEKERGTRDKAESKNKWKNGKIKNMKWKREKNSNVGKIKVLNERVGERNEEQWRIERKKWRKERGWGEKK